MADPSINDRERFMDRVPRTQRIMRVEVQIGNQGLLYIPRIMYLPTIQMSADQFAVETLIVRRQTRLTFKNPAFEAVTAVACSEDLVFVDSEPQIVCILARTNSPLVVVVDPVLSHVDINART